MSRVKISRRCTAAPALALRRAGRHLTALGYHLKEEGPGRVRLEWARSARGATGLHEHRHGLEVAADGKALSFVFTARTSRKGPCTELERRAFLDRALGATRAAQAEPTLPARVGCRLCGQLTNSTATQCEACGAEEFLSLGGSGRPS